MADTKQLTVRVPADLVDWLDGEVARGRYPSRAAGVTRALRRLKRLQEDDEDVRKMLAAGPDPDEESRLEWMRTRTYPDLGDDPESLIPPHLRGDLAAEFDTAPAQQAG